jgi:hypothetical protein
MYPIRNREQSINMDSTDEPHPRLPLQGHIRGGALLEML